MTTTADVAQKIRTDLKAAFPTTKFRVFKNNGGTSINVVIMTFAGRIRNPERVDFERANTHTFTHLPWMSKDAKAFLDSVEKVAHAHQKVSRCQVTGEILAGGNTFVFVSFDSSLVEANEPKTAPVEVVPQIAFLEMAGVL